MKRLHIEMSIRGLSETIVSVFGNKILLHIFVLSLTGTYGLRKTCLHSVLLAGIAPLNLFNKLVQPVKKFRIKKSAWELY